MGEIWSQPSAVSASSAASTPLPRTFSSLQRGRFKERSIQETESVALETSQRTGARRVNKELFPLHVMSVRDVLKLDRLLPHEEMIEAGLVHHVPHDGIVIFVSHQWLSYAHPDSAENVQLRALQRMLAQICEGRVAELFEESDWQAFATGVDTRQMLLKELQSSLSSTQPQLTADGFSRLVGGAYVWWDYFSIPQEAAASRRSQGAPTGSQLLAIHSIPYYLERASLFVVCAPLAAHADTGQRCDLESWRGRGWCRFEECANFLSLNALCPLVLTEQPRLAVEEFGGFWAFRANTRLGAVGCGDFSNDDDRPVCVQILRAMWQEKLRHLAALDNRQLVALYGVLETKLLATSDGTPLRSTHFAYTACGSEWSGSQGAEGMGAEGRETEGRVAEGREAECVRPPSERRGVPSEWSRSVVGRSDVLTDWRLGCLQEEAHPIGTAVVLAMLGDVGLLQAAYDDGRLDLYECHAGSGATTLMHAAGNGDVRSVRWILERLEPGRADGARATFLDKGTTQLVATPLDRAVRCGHTQIVCALLAAGASHTVRRSSGDTPLHAAAEMGRAECAAALLDARADVHARNLVGQTPLHLSTTPFTLFGSQAGKRRVTTLLLAAGARADARDHKGNLPDLTDEHSKEPHSDE